MKKEPAGDSLSLAYRLKTGGKQLAWLLKVENSAYQQHIKLNN